MTDINKDHIEKAAVSIVSNYLYTWNIDNHFNDEDKVPNIDGFFTFDNKDFNTQINGTRGTWDKHKIKRKYFEYALNNFLVYIIVDNITNGIDSINKNIRYTVISFSDAINGLNNKTGMNAKKFDFKILNDISEFKKYIIECYSEYSKNCYKGIQFGDINEKFLSSAKVFGKIKLEDNLVDVKEVTIEEILTPKNIRIKIDKDSVENIYIGNITEQKLFSIPNTDIKINVKTNRITGVNELKYNKLVLRFNTKTLEANMSITDFVFNPFNIKIYAIYQKIIKGLFSDKYIKSRQELDGVIIFIEEVIKFKRFLEDKGLLHEKFNKPEILDFFYRYYKNGIRYVKGRDNVLFYQVGENYIACTNTREKENKILSKALKLTLLRTYKEKELKHEGYTILFYQQVSKFIRACLNFDYTKMIQDDYENLAELYLDEDVTMIVFNYLLIYWEYNKANDMLNKLKEAIEKRVRETEFDNLIINYLQIKRILNESFKDNEFNYLVRKSDADSVLIRLACVTLLQRKLEAKTIYDSLSKNDKMTFNEWPIKYLFDKLM